jgi:hypothetical protein
LIAPRATVFENESGAEIKRARAAHRQVVDRAVDRHRPDVSAWEEERTHDVGVRREGQPRPVEQIEIDHRAVVPRAEHRIVEGRREHSFDELMSQLSAAAVSQQHLRILLNRYRARECDIVRAVH